jgi:hypothetical protein
MSLQESKFFTNEKENTLINKIEGIFKYKNVHFFDALVGYFRASGYFRIRPFVEKTAEIRILVGINIDNLIYEANRKGYILALFRNKYFFKHILMSQQNSRFKFFSQYF